MGFAACTYAVGAGAGRACVVLALRAGPPTRAGAAVLPRARACLARGERHAGASVKTGAAQAGGRGHITHHPRPAVRLQPHLSSGGIPRNPVAVEIARGLLTHSQLPAVQTPAARAACIPTCKRSSLLVRNPSLLVRNPSFLVRNPSLFHIMNRLLPVRAAAALHAARRPKEVPLARAPAKVILFKIKNLHFQDKKSSFSVEEPSFFYKNAPPGAAKPRR